MQGKLNSMMREMLRRDRNRCAVIIWSLSNETYTTTPNRTQALIELTKNWQGKPSAVTWKFAVQKPLIISEFGGEAKYGSHYKM